MTNETEYLKQVKAAAQNGQQLIAYDIAEKAILEFPESIALKFQATLALARAGATQKAKYSYDLFCLSKSKEEDHLALGARLYKDAIFQAEPKDQVKIAEKAANQYFHIYEQFSGYYSAINAATLFYFCNKQEKAKALAQRILDSLTQKTTKDMTDAYYREATKAECYLLLNQSKQSEESCQKAMCFVGKDLSAVSTTRKQFKRFFSHHDLSNILSILAPPKIIHYCGHRISKNDAGDKFLPAEEIVVAKRIQEIIDKESVGFGYGSLASGADILIAEALLAHRAECHIILPFEIEEFKRVSVADSGQAWLERFDKVIDKATSVSFSNEGGYMGDDSLFDYTSRHAMGLTKLHAAFLDADVFQLAVWDGESSNEHAGTAVDVNAWQKLHYESIIIHPRDGQVTHCSEKYHDRKISNSENCGRQLKAIIFGDVKGFSTLNDEALRLFVEHVLPCLANVLKDFKQNILMKNTWGDGLFIVLHDVESAAKCATALQQAMISLDLARIGLPDYLALRLGVHFGPVFQTYDPLLQRENVFGSHVIKTARIEPVTPEGEVYGTEAFAAELSLTEGCEYSAEYVGILPTAKSYGDIRMYLITQK